MAQSNEERALESREGCIVVAKWRTSMKRICNAFGLCAATAMALSAQTFTTVHNFDGTDGELPLAGLAQAIDGNLYGTTTAGGANQQGTIFKITRSGTTTLYNFCAQSGCTDGKLPDAGLLQATDGNLYGTAYRGGANELGTIFSIAPSGTLTPLYSFCSLSGCADGSEPQGTLIESGGNFYGTTSSGGANGAYGTIFEMTASGTVTTLYSFCSLPHCLDGVDPGAGVVEGMDGNFYGTTETGGNCRAPGCGTVFKVTPTGTLTTLYHFCPNPNTVCRDGETPLGGLVQAPNGLFYGTTQAGGSHAVGTVFKITPTGRLTTLYSFCAQPACADGSYPNGGLVLGSDGNLYGTTAFGGTCAEPAGCGTIFMITPGGALTTLHAFCSQSGCTDGETPDAVMIQDTNGGFYGTTNYGGTPIGGCSSGNGCGTIFSLTTFLAQFVKTLQAAGQVGGAVSIIGTDLTGTTSVSFNGTAAVFRVVSSTEITTIVPTGASTGPIQVLTPGGTLSSNVPFRVTP
jgi:uncharacterized repeat protein (TIGR03803 family)